MNPKYGDAMPQKLETISGVQVSRIGLGEFNEYKDKITQLRFNVLGTHANDNLHEKIMPEVRRQQLKPIHKEAADTMEHEAIYLAKDAKGEVVGFMYIELTPDGRHAEMKEMWASMHEASQKEIIEKFFSKIQDEMPEERYPKVHVLASERSKYFDRFAANPRFKVVKLERPSSAEKYIRTGDAASDVTPRANDNVRHDNEKAA